MDGLGDLQLVILLLAVVLVLVAAARRWLVPYPILLVVGGLVLSAIPGLPRIELRPDVVFLVFLPPILWAAAYFTSLRDFRANLRPISLLAFGLVVATTIAVAFVVRLVAPGVPWAVAVAVGAIVSPPDAVAATAIARRLGIPHRIVTVLEGESLVNDASALVLYRAAVAAAVTGAFSWKSLGLDFVYAASVGVAIGLVVGWVVHLVLRALDDAVSEIATTLLAPYAAWAIAESLHASAVLACVAGGLLVRRSFSRDVAPATRMQALAVWQLLLFLLNGAIFILIGLQLSLIRERIAPGTVPGLILQSAAITATAIVVRLVWVPIATWLPRALSRRLRERDPMPPWSAVFLVGWTGMRGIVSLAAALALPFSLPYRDSVLVWTFGVILGTLVLQGLTLTPLIRKLGLKDDATLENEEETARRGAATAAMKRLDELEAEEWVVAEQLSRLRVQYEARLRRFSTLAVGGGVDDDCTRRSAASWRRLRYEAIEAEREAAIALRNDGAISDDVLHRLEHELDVEALRLGMEGRG